LSQTEDQATLEGAAAELAHADRAKKDSEAEHSRARGEFLRLATARAGEGTLARQTVRVPLDYFERTGMADLEYLLSRHPAQRLVESEDDGEAGERVFLLEEDPEYRPLSVSVEEGERRLSVGRTVQTSKPTLDLESLRRDDPDLYDEIMVETVIPARTVSEPSGDKIQEVALRDPSKVAVIQRNTIVPAPSVRLTPIKEEKE
jgi:hypothetical protein